MSSRVGEAQAVDPGVLGGGLRSSALERHARAPGEALDLGGQQRRAQVAAISAASRSAAAAAARSPPADDQRLGLAPAGVAQLERLLQRREALGRRVPRRGSGCPSARESSATPSASNAAGSGPGRAVVPALGGQQGAQAREDRPGVALRLGRPRLRRRARSARCARSAAARSAVACRRVVKWAYWSSGTNSSAPVAICHACSGSAAHSAVSARPAAWLPIHIESLVPPSSSRASSKCSTALVEAAAAHGEMGGVVVQHDRGDALGPLGQHALDDRRRLVEAAEAREAPARLALQELRVGAHAEAVGACRRPRARAPPPPPARPCSSRHSLRFV